MFVSFFVASYVLVVINLFEQVLIGCVALAMVKKDLLHRK